jgi:Zn-dependent peptidase ImmA (M78 family)
MMKVQIKPELLRWASERSGHDPGYLLHRFPKLVEWEQGAAQPSLKQIERFAKVTHTPIGYLFLQRPPMERIPIPDFRALESNQNARPSPDLLETIYICQQRQEWYRDFARTAGAAPLAFVGSVKVSDNVEKTAALIRHALGFDLEERRKMPTWTDALRKFIEQADAMGILVMCSGVVLNNNRRGLNPHEFRGFALADTMAPLIFINGKDTKAAQMFTLAHELAHIWIAQTALSNAQARTEPKIETERWCNSVAAELLVPLSVLKNEYDKEADLRKELDRLAKHFKVSTLVIVRRIYDAGSFSFKEFQNAYEKELEKLQNIPKGSGGDFYLTQAARVSKRFARALVISTWEGRSSFSEALRLLGFKKMATFNDFGHNLGMGFL